MVRVENNISDFIKRFEKASKQARFEVANQILNDSNLYVREDTGALKRSISSGSNLAQGIIGWDTPYAKRVYYLGTPSTDRNPNASLMWVQVARARHGKEWVDFLARKLAEYVE